jgi:predicted  nucleic acid-binding Zn-ribbon protein
MTNHEQMYNEYVKLVEALTERKRVLEYQIDETAKKQFKIRNTLPGTTWEHLANGMKAQDDRIPDLEKKIDRAVAHASMHALGVLIARGR